MVVIDSQYTIGLDRVKRFQSVIVIVVEAKVKEETLTVEGEQVEQADEPEAQGDKLAVEDPEERQFSEASEVIIYPLLQGELVVVKGVIIQVVSPT